MYSLRQSRRIRGNAGEPLPEVFKNLTAKGTKPARGQLILVAAGPGTGKSAFVLTYALKSAVPTLYLSADSDAFVQLTRSISIMTGKSLEDSAQLVLNDNIDVVSEQIDKPIRFSFRASPTLDDIEQSMLSYEEVYGDYPALVVVDNVTNVIGGASTGDDPFSGLESLMDYLSTMARNTEACVIGLHHVTGPYNDADKPIPLSGVKGQITRVPSMVLTLHKKPAEDPGRPDILCVSTVKNRGGKSDPSGYDFAELDFHGETMTITDAETMARSSDTSANPWR